VVCECGTRLGDVSDAGLRLDLWRICICGGEKWYVLKWNYVDFSVKFNVSECFSCYLVHQVAETGIFKVVVMPPSGRGILVIPNS